MNNLTDTQSSLSKNKTEENNIIQLTALELNNIKLDPKHTILTPDYLENLSKEEPTSGQS